ncbi:MAG: hypothetical protein SA339_04070 [Methanomassiliicoccus sp.]|nr:hypothetical protein [Methanomassiliicoccus sp.]
MLATCLYSFLLWAYVVFRIVINRVPVRDDFIRGIPISFWVLGLIAFVVSFVTMVLYLNFWGFSGKNNARSTSKEGTA